MNDKLYVLVRGDLDTGYAMAQSCHATFQFSTEHEAKTKEWMTISNYIAILVVKDEDELMKVASKANTLGILTSIFREPDMDDQVTAIVLEPGQLSKRICNKYKLFGS